VSLATKIAVKKKNKKAKADKPVDVRQSNVFDDSELEEQDEIDSEDEGKEMTCENCLANLDEEAGKELTCNIHDGTYEEDQYWSCCMRLGQRSEGCTTVAHDCKQGVDGGFNWRDRLKQGEKNNGFNSLPWCINCHNRFRENKNHGGACVVHTGTWDGEWSCCNLTPQKSIGCRPSEHIATKKPDWGKHLEEQALAHTLKKASTMVSPKRSSTLKSPESSAAKTLKSTENLKDGSAAENMIKKDIKSPSYIEKQAAKRGQGSDDERPATPEHIASFVQEVRNQNQPTYEDSDSSNEGEDTGTNPTKQTQPQQTDQGIT